MNQMKHYWVWRCSICCPDGKVNGFLWVFLSVTPAVTAVVKPFCFSGWIFCLSLFTIQCYSNSIKVMVINVGDEVVKRDSGSKKKSLVKTESYQLNDKVFGKIVADKNQTKAVGIWKEFWDHHLSNGYSEGIIGDEGLPWKRIMINKKIRQHLTCACLLLSSRFCFCFCFAFCFENGDSVSSKERLWYNWCS